MSKLLHFLKNFFKVINFSLKNFNCLACIVSEIFRLKKRMQQKGKVNHIVDIIMEMSYNQKILVNTIAKVIYYVTFM